MTPSSKCATNMLIVTFGDKMDKQRKRRKRKTGRGSGTEVIPSIMTMEVPKTLTMVIP